MCKYLLLTVCIYEYLYICSETAKSFILCLDYHFVLKYVREKYFKYKLYS